MNTPTWLTELIQDLGLTITDTGLFEDLTIGQTAWTVKCGKLVQVAKCELNLINNTNARKVGGRQGHCMVTGHVFNVGVA
jgi:hypothetical protein